MYTARTQFSLSLKRHVVVSCCCALRGPMEKAPAPDQSTHPHMGFAISVACGNAHYFRHVTGSPIGNCVLYCPLSGIASTPNLMVCKCQSFRNTQMGAVGESIRGRFVEFQGRCVLETSIKWLLQHQRIYVWYLWSMLMLFAGSGSMLYGL